MGAILIGRRDEVALLAQRAARVREASTAVLVTGEAGIGKTTLVESVMDAVPAGVRVLRGAAAPMCGHVAPEGLPALVEAPAEAPDSGFPSVAAGYAWATERILRAIVSDSDDSAPTVLVLEDLQWADRATLDLSAELCRNLPDHGLVVLMTWRDDERVSADHGRWLAEQQRCPSVELIELQPLSLEETIEQIRHLGLGPSEQLARAVYQRSGGNPYINAELALTGGGDGTSLRQVLQARLAGCSPGERVAVAAAGALGRPVDDDTLLAAVDGDAEAIRGALAARVLLRGEDGCRPRHPMLATVAYYELLAPEARAMHARLARHLRDRVLPDATAASVAEVAEQFRRAGNQHDTLVWAVRAAATARSAYTLAEAGYWYAVACELWDQVPEAHPLVPDRLVLVEAAADLLTATGQHARAVEVLDHAPGPSPRSAEAVPALLARSWLRIVLGDTDGAVADGELALGLAPADDLQLLGRAHGRLADVLATSSRWADAVPHARAALDLAGRTSDEPTVASALIVLGAADSSRGDVAAGTATLERALALALKVAQPDLIVLAAVVLSDAWLAAGEAARAEEVARRVRPAVRRLFPGRRHWLEGLLDGNVAEALADAGRWDEALEWVDEAADTDLYGFVAIIGAKIALERGDLEVTRAWLARVRQLERDNQPQFHHQAAALRAQMLLVSGRPEEALEVSLESASVVHGTAPEASAVGLLLIGLQAAAVLGRPDQVDRLVDLLGATRSSRLGPAVRPLVVAERQRSQGAWAPEPWAAAAEAWHGLGRPLYEARARFHLAEALLASRAKGARANAAHELGLAHQAAVKLGATVLCREIEDLAALARIGLATPSAPSAPVSSSHGQFGALTEQELRVLGLLTKGLTNTQIGEELFISPKTASVHVTHILAKLGVQTRVEAAALATRNGLDGPLQD